jgi:selenoprotein W-related protein
VSEPVGRSARVAITYCTQCRWLLRAGWLASELLTTFTTDLGEVALVPGTGGVFRVELDGELLWDRTRDGGFPEIAPLKRLVRDRVAPGRPLGHTDRAAESPAS